MTGELRRAAGRASVAWLLLAAAVAAAAPAAGQDPLAGFDAYVREAMQAWRVPGMAIGIVKDDSVVFLRGFGTRTVGRDEPVDTHTLFANASTTKAFTAAAVAMLVDDGVLAWDDPVTNWLPELRLRDAYVTRALTVRDLLSHRSGLPNLDVLWYVAGYDFPEIMGRLAEVEPDGGFRGGYIYNNVLYGVAGRVIEAASGMPWDAFIRSRILEPLGMRRTVMTSAELAGRRNVATPHDTARGRVVPIPRLVLDNVAPAGSMRSSAADMVKWLRFQLDSARVGGRRLIEPASWHEMLEQQTVIPVEQYYPAVRQTDAHFTGYGLGWFLQDYRGRLVAMHTGSIDGMVALAALMPAERLGLIIFGNLDHAEVRHALMYRIFDLYTGAAARDWSRDLLELYRESAARRDSGRTRHQALRVEGTSPSLPLSGYEGVYDDPLVGTMHVVLENGRLVAKVSPAWIGDLEHWHYDTFRVNWRHPTRAPAWISFSLDAAARVREAAVEFGFGDVVELDRQREPEPATAAK